LLRTRLAFETATAVLTGRRSHLPARASFPVRQIVAKRLSARPEDRYQSASDLLDALFETDTASNQQRSHLPSRVSLMIGRIADKCLSVLASSPFSIAVGPPGRPGRGSVRRDGFEIWTAGGMSHHRRVLRVYCSSV